MGSDTLHFDLNILHQWSFFLLRFDQTLNLLTLFLWSGRTSAASHPARCNDHEYTAFPPSWHCDQHVLGWSSACVFVPFWRIQYVWEDTVCSMIHSFPTPWINRMSHLQDLWSLFSPVKHITPSHSLPDICTELWFVQLLVHLWRHSLILQSCDRPCHEQNLQIIRRFTFITYAAGKSIFHSKLNIGYPRST